MARPGSGRAIYISGENTLAPDDLAALWRAVDYCGSAGGASSAAGWFAISAMGLDLRFGAEPPPGGSPG